MNIISNKDELKDNLIIALIDTILELYTYNYKFNYDEIRNNILSNYWGRTSFKENQQAILHNLINGKSIRYRNY